MNKPYAEQLKTELECFTGTTQYHRLTSNSVLTDGAKYLADQAGSYWLAILFASYLAQLTDSFAVLKLRKVCSGAEVVIEGGNDNIHYQQRIDFTDFPLESITLFAGKNVKMWVIMLPSEY